MDMQHLKYFMVVATEGNFTRAAEKLYVSQPTISKMVRSIETEFGVTLFDRSRKHVQLTDAGKVVLEQAQHMLRAYQNLSSELDDLMALKKGELHIGLPPMVGARFFPKIIQAFYRKYPNIKLHVVEDGAVKIESAVQNGTLDLGVVVLPVDEKQFDGYAFAEENLMLVTPAKHLLRYKKAVRLKDLKEEAFILFRRDFTLHDRIIDECERAGFRPNIIYESSQWDFIGEMVRADLGVALLPESICRQMNPADVAMIPLVDPGIPWNLGIVWRKERYLSFAAREWIRFMKKVTQQNKEI
ncbi:cidABC operon transcriptional activator CidR [Virgibacillus halophilus]|uniref:cidABC operon transcriptional activator CidR n=1 Tax=Tigheibacillus halophilus TaxID=361280 RepID=UPI00363B460A